MRICVLSDTHIPDRYDDLPEKVWEDIRKADLVVHAGDFTSSDLYNKIKALKGLKAVLGNIDSGKLKNILKTKEIFQIKNHRIGLTHGSGKPEAVLDNVRKTFTEPLDLVIFGHTHNAFCEKIGRTIYFNPGSPTDKIFSNHNSYGIIDIEEDIKPKIIKL